MKDGQICAAVELVQQEVMAPLHGMGRAGNLLFSDGTGKLFPRTQVEAGIKDTIKLAVALTDVKNDCFRSYRVHLCVALDSAGCLPSKIKRRLRWMSDESLLAYARDGAQMHAKGLAEAVRATTNALRVYSLPARPDYGPEMQILLANADDAFKSDPDIGDDWCSGDLFSDAESQQVAIGPAAVAGCIAAAEVDYCHYDETQFVTKQRVTS